MQWLSKRTTSVLTSWKWRNRIVTAAVMLLPLLSVVLASIGLVLVHKKYQLDEASRLAAEVAKLESKRFVAMFNLRLNSIREDLVHLYQEQAALGKKSDANSARGLFYRREHIAGFAVMMAPEGESKNVNVHNYYVREGGLIPDGVPASDKVLELFRSAALGMGTTGFFMERVNMKKIDEAYASYAGAPTWYLIAYLMPDDNNRNTVFAGLFKAAYVFPFCRYFSDKLSDMETNAYVLDDRGMVLCHSQARFDGTSFHELPQYLQIKRAADTGSATVRYEKPTDGYAVAEVKLVTPGNVTMITESTESLPWKTAIPAKELAAVMGFVLAVTLIVMFWVARQVGRDLDLSKLKPFETQVAGQTPAQTTDVSHLEKALLDLQSERAWMAAFQHQASSATSRDDLIRTLTSMLGGLGEGVVAGWLNYDPKEKCLLGTFGSADEIKIQHEQEGASFKKQDVVFAVLSGKTRLNNIKVQAVFKGEVLVGVLAVGWPDSVTISGVIESTPQISNIISMVMMRWNS